MTDVIGLTDLSRELQALTQGSTCSYRQLYRLTLDGVLPVEKSSNGRWVARRKDLPRIAELLGLTIKASA